MSSNTDFLSKLDVKSTSGNISKAICPFHSEKTPSMFLNFNLELFKCFGCGIGGTFNRLNKLLNLKTKRFTSKSYKNFSANDISLRSMYLDLTYDILSYARNEIFKSKFRKIIQYLHYRGLTDQHILRFNIGFVSEYRFDSLQHVVDSIKNLFFNKKKCTFDNSLLFPVYDFTTNDICGFLYKKFDMYLKPDLNFPKYVHMKTNEFYSAKENLFFVFQYENTNRMIKNIVLVEGIFDVYSVTKLELNEHNLVLGTFGVNLTLKQIQNIQNISYEKQLYVWFDNDLAGFTSILKIVDSLSSDVICIDWDIATKIVADVKDVDELILKCKIKLFVEIPVTNIVKFVEFGIQNFVQESELEMIYDIISKGKYIQKIFTQTSKLRNFILNSKIENKYEILLDYLAKRLNNFLSNENINKNDIRTELFELQVQYTEMLNSCSDENVNQIVHIKQKIHEIQNRISNGGKI